MNDDIQNLIRETLAQDRRDSFSDGFADRTMARLKDLSREESFGDVMARQLKRLTPIAIAAALILGFYNTRSSAGIPTVDRLLGLTTITVDAAYDLGSNL